MDRLAVITAVLSFLLVVAGGLVTSTDSGLSVPDWPLSYGTVFPPFVGGIRYEHTHRIIAALVGLLTLILSVSILAKETRRSVRWFSLFAFGLVVFQGILGGLTVLWQLPVPISVAHACLGQTFFAAILVLADLLSPRWQMITPDGFATPGIDGGASFLRRLSLATLSFLYGQLILGAALRHMGWIPTLVAAHVGCAVLVFFCVAKVYQETKRNLIAKPLFIRPARAMAMLLHLQILLGVVTWASAANVVVATLHVAVGALLLGTSAVFALRTFYFLKSPIRKSTGPCTGTVAGTGLPLSIYLELTKPRLTLLAVATSVIGFLLGLPDPVSEMGGWNLHWMGRFFALSLGTALVGAGAGALNEYLERGADARMIRTKGRPIPSGRILPESALRFGVILSVGGLLTLFFGAGGLASSLAALTLGLYLFVYTPLKSKSPLCTLIGAVPGAIPPMIGWASARGELGLGAWILFSFLFLWQLPHFLAIAWICREDYKEAGFQMLPVLDPQGRATFRQITLYCAALIPVALFPSLFGLAGKITFLAALGGGLIFLAAGLRLRATRSIKAARQLFLISLLYLPGLLITMTFERIFG